MTPSLSVVIPVYMNASTLAELHQRLAVTLERTRASFEIVFVNDASPDGSTSELARLAASDPRVVVIELPVNVGQHWAIFEGLRRARGLRTVIMDADLQDPPEAIPPLADRLDGTISAVFAGRRGVHQPWGRRISSRTFKTLLHRLCGTPIDAGVFVSLDGALRERLIGMSVPGPSILAMIGVAGLPMTSVPVRRDVRRTGVSAYSSRRRLTLAAKVITWILRRKYAHS